MPNTVLFWVLIEVICISCIDHLAQSKAQSQSSMNGLYHYFLNICFPVIPLLPNQLAIFAYKVFFFLFSFHYIL